MRTVPIAELLQYQPGEVPPSISGVIKRVWKRHGGNTNGDDWTIQNILVGDGNGSEIKVKLTNHPEIERRLVNCPIRIIATEKSNGGGLCGLKMDEEEYPTGKFTPVLKVTDKGELLIGDDAGQSVQQQAARPAPTTTGPATRSKADPDMLPTEEEHAANQVAAAQPLNDVRKENLEKLKKRIPWLGASYKFCLKEASDIVKDFESATGTKISPDGVKEIATSMFIKLDREGLI